jgi:hypothetical protein
MPIPHSLYDREKYTINKSDFIEGVIKKALEELKNKS